MYWATARLVLLCLALLAVVPASASERSKLKDAVHQVESGAKSIGSGIENTAKGIGNTVVEGAKTAGQRLELSGRAVEPQVKNAWQHVKKGASDFGQSVSSFFSQLVGK
jgi:hypothetical protein